MTQQTQPRPRIGVDIKNDGRTHDLTARQWVDCAREAEECGFDSVWLNEDVGHDSLMILALAAQATSHINIGTAIVNVFHRSAMQLAMGVATLDEVSGGRAVIGLSSGHHPWNDLHHGIPIQSPLARVREYVTFMRKALTGEPFTHDGRIYQGVRGRLAFRPPNPHVPIYVAGVLPGMIKLAGEVGDGLLINAVPASYIQDFVAGHLAASASAAGRDAGQLELMAIVTCCLSDDPAEALNLARETFLWRQSMNPERMKTTFRPQFHEELMYLSRLASEGEGAKAQRQASRELVSSVIANGSAEDLWRSINAFLEAGCTRVAVAPYPRDEVHVKRLLHALSPYVSRAAEPVPA